MAHGSVYLATNNVTGRQYVGQTVTGVAKRWSEHVRSRYVAKCRLLSRAICKHGAGAFTVTTLGECDSPASLNASEQFAIAWLGTLAPRGYNLTTGGEAAYHRSDDTRARISRAWTPAKRRAWSDRWREPATRQLLAHRRSQPPIPLVVIAADGSRQEFGSCQEACMALGLKASLVSRCLNGRTRHKRHKGYSFERLAKE